MNVNSGDRRGLILSAALEVFNERGIEGAAIGDIADRSHASVGSIYHHFGSKEGIALALLAEGLRGNTRTLEKRLRKARGARGGIRALVESLVSWIADNPDWARFIYAVSHGGANRTGDAEPRTEIREVNEAHARLIEDYFAPHIRVGAFRRLPRECFASLVLGPVHDYARRWLNGQVSGDIGKHVDVFAAAAWNAVRNPRDA